MKRFMLYAGSDDGVYRVPGVEGATAASASRVLQSDRVYRLRTFDGVGGLFAATDSGLYHTADGDEWSRVPHPRERVYAVVASPDGERLYTGTKPAEL